MIYWLFLNLTLFHCTIKVATHIYRSTAVHDVSITQSFCAFNCAVFSSSVYVCYMWDWVMWWVYWLCCVETWQMWVSISQMLFNLCSQNLLGLCSVQRIDTDKNIFQCPNGKYFILCIYQRMNTLHKEMPSPMLQPCQCSDLEFLKLVSTGTWINSRPILRYIFWVRNILYIEIVLPQNIIS